MNKGKQSFSTTRTRRARRTTMLGKLTGFIMEIGNEKTFLGK